MCLPESQALALFQKRFLKAITGTLRYYQTPAIFKYFQQIKQVEAWILSLSILWHVS
jgi:hypothetical protein